VKGGPPAHAPPPRLQSSSCPPGGEHGGVQGLGAVLQGFGRWPLASLQVGRGAHAFVVHKQGRWMQSCRDAGGDTKVRQLGFFCVSGGNVPAAQRRMCSRQQHLLLKRGRQHGGSGGASATLQPIFSRLSSRALFDWSRMAALRHIQVGKLVSSFCRPAESCFLPAPLGAGFFLIWRSLPAAAMSDRQTFHVMPESGWVSFAAYWRRRTGLFGGPSRSERSAAAHAPRPRPPAPQVNDPNGPLLYGDTYHL
jgi:hypothetical protein